MQDLRLVAANERGSHLVLRSPAGDRFLLPIDERLRAAARGDRARLGRLEPEGDGRLRPRDIQARIRAGATAEQVASEAGVAVERVQRFEGPVLAERAHMATMAQQGAVRSMRVEGRAGTLAEALPTRLGALGVKVDDLEWDSWRRDDGRWTVTLAYEHEDDAQDARFLYDPTARTVVPADDQARWLLGELEQRPVRGPFVPRLAELPPDPADEVDEVPEDAADTDPEQPAAVGEPPVTDPAARPARGPIRRPDPTADRRPPDVVARPMPTAPESLGGPARRPAPAVSAQPAIDLPGIGVPAADAPSRAVAPAVRSGSRRERRAARRQVVETPPSAEKAEPAEDVVETPEQKTGTTDARGAAPRSGRSRRASVPSWDDILFGTRAKD